MAARRYVVRVNVGETTAWYGGLNTTTDGKTRLTRFRSAYRFTSREVAYSVRDMLAGKRGVRSAFVDPVLG